MEVCSITHFSRINSPIATSRSDRHVYTANAASTIADGDRVRVYCNRRSGNGESEDLCYWIRETSGVRESLCRSKRRYSIDNFDIERLSSPRFVNGYGTYRKPEVAIGKNYSDSCRDSCSGCVSHCDGICEYASRISGKSISSNGVHELIRTYWQTGRSYLAKSLILIISGVRRSSALHCKCHS